MKTAFAYHPATKYLGYNPLKMAIASQNHSAAWLKILKNLKKFNFFKVPSRKVLYIKTIEGR
jgi:hypothetical protein